MTIVITEDTSLGYKLIEAVANEVYNGDVLVVSSAYASEFKKVGGYSMLYATISKLIKERKINKRADRVIVIYDNFLRDPNVDFGTKEALSREIRACDSVLKRIGVRHKLVGCTCFEEVLGSFRYLFNFCDPENNTLHTPERKMLSQIRKGFWGKSGDRIRFDAVIDYQAVFSSAPPEYYKENTCEGRIKTCISKFMAAAKFSRLRVQPNRSYLGECWSKDCADMKDAELCSKCIGRKKPIGGAVLSTSRGRLLVLYRYSLFKMIFDI